MYIKLYKKSILMVI